MGDALVMDRLSETLDAPPVVRPAAVLDDGVPAELKERTAAVIEKSRNWLAVVTESVERARQHKEHSTQFAAAWPNLEQHLTRAIRTRERMIEGELGKVRKSPAFHGEFKALFSKIERQLKAEHTALVALYYLLASDAAEAASNTVPVGNAIQNAADLDSYFEGFGIL